MNIRETANDNVLIQNLWFKFSDLQYWGCMEATNLVIGLATSGHVRPPSYARLLGSNLSSISRSKSSTTGAVSTLFSSLYISLEPLEAMRLTLRRSCDACAKAKHSCDLRTPQCSRCVKRKSQCVYANRPLNPPARDQELMRAPQPASTALDPFDSYPPTRLPRAHVQRLIHHCN